MEKKMRNDWIHKLTCIIASLLTALILLAGTSLYYSYCEAATSAVVSGAAALNVRSGPGTDYDNVTTNSGEKITLPNGYSVTILDETRDSSGTLWYYISFTYEYTEKTGYVLSDYIKEKTSTGTAGDFESYLDAQGFPESYREALRTLHAQHPAWVFEAQHTNLEWQDALQEESKVGKNLIQNSAISSWKSMEAGAYDYTTNKWVVFDGSDWVSASRELIAYYLDPRNFLNDTEIFQFETLSYDNTYQTIYGVQNILGGSFMDKSYTDTDGWTETYAEAFIYAAEKSGVSPYHLAARCIQEVGTQGSSATGGQVSGYEGIFNFYNIGATSSSNPVVLGLSFASQYNDTYFLPWDAQWKAIAGGAIYLGTRYINVGQDTLYLQKFNVQGSNPYSHQYMTNVQAPTMEARKMAGAYGANVEQAIAFKIPVYKNMPETVCEAPKGSGGSVTALSSLTVDGYSLSPTFHKDTLEYDLVLTEMVNFVTVRASTMDESAKISGTGTIELIAGLNSIPITVTAQNGSSVVYTINISNPSDESTVNSGGYSINIEGKIFLSVLEGESVTAMLYGFEVGTTVEQLAKEITAVNCSYRILNADTTEKSSDSVLATGNILQVINSFTEEVIKEYFIVIYGDINGDGEISGRDMLYLQRHLLDLAPLTGAYAEAADVNWSDSKENAEGAKISTISAKDMLYLQRHLLDMQKISQK